jgi:hypothetical protein
MRYYLIVYRPSSEELIETKEFVDEEAAQRAYVAAERANREDALRVLLFAADSLETVKQTHPHYFAAAGRETAPFPAV